MKALSAIDVNIYNQIDNELYNKQGDIWWDENTILYMLKTSINPCRFPYYLKAYTEALGRKITGKQVLDVGCGGGILAEEFAAAGFTVTGIDPSENSLDTARNHATLSGLSIDYRKGTGESIEFDDNSFDIVCCCDVLEHVRDLPKCISEISRVLKPGGVFFFDTFNRTPLSKFIVIKLFQEWRTVAFMPPNLHVYDMFIKPSELKELMFSTGLNTKEIMGMKPNVNPLKMIRLMRKRVTGKLNYGQLGRQVRMRETTDTKVGYLGYAIKE